MSDPTARTEDDTPDTGVPPVPPEAHQGAATGDKEESQYLGTATYSPEDNKLRLYPFSRLVKAGYERVKGAGFSWAPKQQLFVAPMWTPGRAALLVALCGEIGDEDRSLMDRAQERAERFDDYSERRGAQADAARQQVEAITEHIPLGQPILVGHHSERRARRDAERIEAGMRKAIRLWETRGYWEQRARAAQQHAACKQDPAVRYRRLKGIEADLRKALKIIEEAGAFMAMWQRPGLSREQAITIAGHDSVRIAETGQTWGSSAHDLLTRAAPRVLEDVVRLAIAFHDRRITHQRQWVAHYEHRIAYERAMLEAEGGLAAEIAKGAVALQPGGRVRIGAEWLTIVRVNRKDGQVVSVTTNGRHVPVRGVERIAEYEPPSEAQAATVKAAKKLPPLANYAHAGAVEMTQAQWKHLHGDYKGTRESGQGARPAGYGRPALGDADASDASGLPHGLHRIRVVVQGGALRTVFITDAKAVPPPKAQVAPADRPAVAAPMPVVPAGMPAVAAAPSANAVPVRDHASIQASIRAMGETLRAGGVQAVSAPQLYATPAGIARHMVAIARPQPGERVLEPSAGSGNLLRALPGVVPFGVTKQGACEVMAVEVNLALYHSLVNDGLAQRVICRDFLECSVEDLGRFDVILMNPPFANGADIAHITHAQQFLAPGGRLVAICADGPRQRIAFSAQGGYEPLPEGSCASAGTQVRTALVAIRR